VTDESSASSRSRRERIACPQCGAAGVHVVRGHSTSEAHRAEIGGDVVLGGCTAGGTDPAWECTACQWRFSDVGTSGELLSAKIVWEDRGALPDCAFAALGDPALLADGAWVAQGRLPFLQVRRSGLGMLYGRAECDGLPVELGRIGGHAAAARLEFTNDVAELDAARGGNWVALGRLRIGNRGAIAVDMKHRHSPAWRHHLPLPPGWYRAEVFEWDGDHLGIRLLAEEVPG
jgi:hypothetical protein